MALVARWISTAALELPDWVGPPLDLIPLDGGWQAAGQPCRPGQILGEVVACQQGGYHWFD